MCCENIRKRRGLLIENFSIFFVVTFPILEAYSIFGIPITAIFSIIIIFLNLFYKRTLKVSIKKIYLPLLIYVLFTCLLSLNGLLVLNNYKNLVNALIMQFINIFAYLIAWENIEFNKMISFADIVAYICCLYVCFQFFMLITGREVPIGKIPFLSVNTTWIPEIWGFRFNSLFSEPSYFAIFLLPIFSAHLINFEWKKSIIFGTFILLSSSTLGIITMSIIIIEQVISGKIAIRKKVTILFGIICIILILNWILNNSLVLSNILNRTFDKAITIFDSQDNTNDIRKTGHLKYYNFLPVKEKILGVGISQLRNYYLEHGYDLSNYSNSFVLTLINSGIIGFFILVIYLIDLLKISLKNKSFVFFIILFLTLLGDSILIGYRFYWLCMFIYLFKPKEESEI